MYAGMGAQRGGVCLYDEQGRAGALVRIVVRGERPGACERGWSAVVRAPASRPAVWYEALL